MNSYLRDAIVATFLVVCPFSHAVAENALENLLKTQGEPKQLKSPQVQGFTVDQLSRSDDDIRRQKEEAAGSLNQSIKEIDDRTRTRAIEDGKAFVLP